LINTNANLSAALRLPDGSTNVAQQIREQLLAGNPEAASKYDAMVNALMSGQMNVDDLRREAQSSADQLREFKRDLGPDADSVDGYLDVLDDFLKETDNAPTNTAPVTTHQAP
jgi:predicted ATP-grasp superfamily ATP-dependent carboligase